MSEEPGEMPTPATGEMSEAPAIDLQKELDLIRLALKKANAEAAKYRKLVETIEAERKAQADAELSEMEKLHKELAETKQRATALELSQRKAAIAAEVGLPPALANRLQGETDDDMRADAESILALIPPATATKQPPQLKPTNMAGASEVIETREQRLKRLGFA